MKKKSFFMLLISIIILFLIPLNKINAETPYSPIEKPKVEEKPSDIKSFLKANYNGWFNNFDGEFKKYSYISKKWYDFNDSRYDTHSFIFYGTHDNVIEATNETKNDLVNGRHRFMGLTIDPTFLISEFRIS